MDIFIKSFNRPYYLERCILSIHQYVIGNYKIIVLDDGTPGIYLEKIKKLFPEIEIHLSGFCNQKTEAISMHISGIKKYKDYSIPVDFWKDRVRQGTDIFLLLEEDAWLINPINVDEIGNWMSSEGFEIVKLFWSGNPFIVNGCKTLVNHDVEEIIPDLPIENLFIAELLLKNRFRIRSLLLRSKIISSKFLVPYYALYTVASAFFRKEYWLFLWENAQPRVNEMQQLWRALNWKQQQHSRYGKTRNERLRTSYITSSVNSIAKIDFDMIRFNYVLNEEWLHGNLDPKQNLPMDFSVDYLKMFLPQGYSDCNGYSWDSWAKEFQNDFRKSGCVIN